VFGFISFIKAPFSISTEKEATVLFGTNLSNQSTLSQKTQGEKDDDGQVME
jgi:hypothetical protein